jgi:LuxR family maltose regulon positive regulatory protein
MNQGLYDKDGNYSRKLTLISAPAGYGKSTLAAEWMRGKGTNYRAPSNVAWLSVDEGDDDPARFFAYLEAALKAAGINLDSTTKGFLRSSQPPTPESLAGLFINEFIAAEMPFFLALDDYHYIESHHIQETVAFLLANQPPQIHIVIITREDPPFSLARLRGRGELIEVRQSDLRFNENEADAYLNGVMKLRLNPDEVAALEERTEGWIAGLQLAALAVQGEQRVQADTSLFVQSFTGSNRFILDYLIEEVYQRQPEEIQTFLLQTAILDRLNGPLCAAVTGRDDSQNVIQKLEDENLFIIPLDDRRQWFRYHHLFADLLRYRSQEDGENGILHCRASEWYENNGFLTEAVHHALAASDWQRAARLINETGDQLLATGQVTTLLRWIQSLPDTIVMSRPSLCDMAGWALAITGHLEAAERYGRAMESVNDPDEEFLGNSLALQAYIARARHDVPRTIELSNKALTHLPPDDHHSHCVLEANLGVAYLYGGELTKAMEVWTKAVENARRSSNYHAGAVALSFIGQIQAAWGRLHQAADLQRQAIQLGEEMGASPSTARAHVNLAALLYEWNDLVSSIDHSELALSLGKLVGDKHVQRDSYRMLALSLLAQGDRVRSLEALNNARPLLHGDNVSVSARLATAITHVIVALVRGDLAMATRWWERIDELTPIIEPIRFDLLSNAGFLSPQLELIQARLLLAQGEVKVAADLSASCYEVAHQGGFGYSLVNARVLEALAADESREAVSYLIDALMLAQPEGYVRTFADAGERVGDLLREITSSDNTFPRAYSESLLLNFPDKSASLSKAWISSSPYFPTEALLDPLSERELELMLLLAQHRSNAEIAQTLMVSLNTVKTHLRHIYEKLNVHDRRAAVNRARELGLISR